MRYRSAAHEPGPPAGLATDPLQRAIDDVGVGATRRSRTPPRPRARPRRTQKLPSARMAAILTPGRRSQQGGDSNLRWTERPIPVFRGRRAFSQATSIGRPLGSSRALTGASRTYTPVSRCLQDFRAVSLAAVNCRRCCCLSLVMKGSPVRVRASALRKPRKWGLFLLSRGSRAMDVSENMSRDSRSFWRWPQWGLVRPRDTCSGSSVRAVRSGRRSTGCRTDARFRRSWGRHGRGGVDRQRGNSQSGWPRTAAGRPA